MWKKMFRKDQSLNYRKKYKCPECNEYSLYLIHDRACECETGCVTENFNIDQIKKDNNFCGYYTSQELIENFWTDDELCNKMLKDITINNTLSLLTSNEKQTIESFFEKTSKFDDRLDDIMVDYLNSNNLKVQNINPFGYLINLIEDTHFFINLCCKDIVLFNYGVEFASKHFYSGRFFYNNAIEHLFQANERMYVILGILFKFDFDPDLSLNKTFKIEKFIKKDSSYKNSQYKIIFERLKGNNFYKDLKEIRDSNTHDLSHFSKTIGEDIKTHGNKKYEYWNRDGDQVDKDLYLPKIKNIIFCLHEFYNLLDQILLQVSNDKSLYKLEVLPMLERFLELEDNITFETYNNKYFEKVETNKLNLFNNLSDYRNPLINDVFFRMDEVSHCIADIYLLAGDDFYKYWRYIGLDLVGLIDDQYLLYSALFRIYACYDKLSRYIAQINSNYSDTMYFVDFAKITNNSIIVREAKSILSDDNYKLLFELRNNIYHNLRAGCLYGDYGLNYFNLIVATVVFENTETIYKFINFLNPKNKVKVGRNEPCPCGSGKKFKKCCGLLTTF